MRRAKCPSTLQIEHVRIRLSRSFDRFRVAERGTENLFNTTFLKTSYSAFCKENVDFSDLNEHLDTGQWALDGYICPGNSFNKDMNL